MLEAELSSNLGYEKYEKTDKNTSNSRNGYTQKTVKTQFGEMEIDIPRYRNGEFEPKIVPKHKRDISGIEEKIIALYAKGMSTRDIHDQIKEIYGIDVSAEMVSKITERIVPEIKSWQLRPLEKTYPFIFMDAIHYKVRTDGHIINRAAYVVLGVTIEGNKDILGIWIGENESSRFWLGVLNELKNRGVEDVLSPFYKFPNEIRKIMYTTNIIEGFHRQLRKATKSKAIFPSDESLEKMLYLVSMNVVKKWTQRYKNWDMVLNQLLIMYPGRLEKYI